jgi:hypothetical protein
MSPTSNVTGWCNPAAYPIAVLKIPSIPDAPLFIATFAKAEDDTEEDAVANDSTSLTGILLDKNSPCPAGMDRATKCATMGSFKGTALVSLTTAPPPVIIPGGKPTTTAAVPNSSPISCSKRVDNVFTNNNNPLPPSFILPQSNDPSSARTNVGTSEQT